MGSALKKLARYSVVSPAAAGAAYAVDKPDYLSCSKSHLAARSVAEAAGAFARSASLLLLLLATAPGLAVAAEVLLLLATAPGLAVAAEVLLLLVSAPEGAGGGGGGATAHGGASAHGGATAIVAAVAAAAAADPADPADPAAAAAAAANPAPLFPPPRHQAYQLRR